MQVSLNIKVAACLAGGLVVCVSGYYSFLFSSTSAIEPDPTPAKTTVQLPGATTAEALGIVALTITETPVPIQPIRPPTPSVEPMPIPTPKGPPYAYHIIAPGETLGYIAPLYRADIGSLVKMNNLSGPSAIIQVDQLLRVPVQTDAIAPNRLLLPDSEVVYSPAYVDFDAAKFVNDQAGYLAAYREYVEGQELNGAEIVERVSMQYSVGPRLLLALLEYYGGWVTNPTPTEAELQRPLGPRNPRGNNLYLALSFTANRVNAGYYGYKRDGFWIFSLADGNQAISAQGINAGTVGLQNILAIHSDWDTWQQEVGPEGFLTAYNALFGEPSRYGIGPVVPITLTQPSLSLPWQAGEGFYFTSGPHPAFVDGSAWAAVDFGPPDVLGSCFYSNEPVTAAADAVVVGARQGEIYLDLDNDGQIQTGWVLFYLHVALDIDTPIQVGQQLRQGEIVGYASCEGGLSNSSHVHFARRYNGEWMDAGGPVPMILSGWVVQPNLVSYQGTIKKGSQTREACECWDAAINLIVNNVPE